MEQQFTRLNRFSISLSDSRIGQRSVSQKRKSHYPFTGLAQILFAVFFVCYNLLSATAQISSDGKLSDPREARSSGEVITKTRHFTIRWRPAETKKEEVEKVKVRAEQACEAFVKLLGRDKAPRTTITILLNGDSQNGEVPTVSLESGEIILVRFPGLGGDYTASLAHELVHAWRWKLWKRPELQTDAFLFVDEGLAETLAVEAGFPSASPTYGTPISIAAGAWLKTGQDIPIPMLVRRHKTLNFRCLAQAYTLRLSFFTFLRKLYGLEPLIELAYQTEPLKVEDFQKTFGASVEELGAVWRGWALREFDKEPKALERARAYRKNTPINYFPVCSKKEIEMP